MGRIFEQTIRHARNWQLDKRSDCGRVKKVREKKR
jgi:hypothetical protein